MKALLLEGPGQPFVLKDVPASLDRLDAAFDAVLPC